MYHHSPKNINLTCDNITFNIGEDSSIWNRCALLKLKKDYSILKEVTKSQIKKIEVND